MVVICPNCKQRFPLPEGKSSPVRCEWCKKVFDYPTPNRTEILIEELGSEMESLQENQPFTDAEKRLLEEREKTAQLFDYFAKVLSIDLPVVRDILEYKEQLRWLSDVTIGPSCQLRKVDSDETSGETPEAGWWLRVRKTEIKEAPPLPKELQGWAELDSRNPSKLPEAILTRSRDASFSDDFNKEGSPENLNKNREIIDKEFISEDRFEDDPKRVDLLQNYIANQWEPWSKSVMPYFRANQLYSELFSLHQRLQIDGERIEFLCGHAFLTWKHKQGDTINHPLFVTPTEVHFDPDNRTISLLPIALLPTTPEFDCLRDLGYDNMAKIVELNDELTKKPPDVWDNKEMYGLAQTITGLISPDGVNKYDEVMCSKPPVEKRPAIWNAPLFFIRPRPKRFWVQDAEQVRDIIKNGGHISWFIQSLTAEPSKIQQLNIDGGNIDDPIPEGELLFPLLYNEEQKEIAQRLRNHSGVLVQGPPGTGKSHTIANIICSLLAQGKRILVTAQTERALRVLRGMIPREIQNLCVNQLGSDIDSRKETEGAVREICGRLDRGKDPTTQSRIEEIRRKLRSNRENQAKLRKAIREWVEINFEALSLGIEKIDAVKAAQEISANKQAHGWFPDKLPPSDEPPLANEELEELCKLLSLIKPEDRQALFQKLPTPQDLPNPDKFKEIVSRLQNVSQVLEQTGKVAENRTALETSLIERLKSASPDFIEEVSELTKNALTKLRQITEGWQNKILSHLSAQGNRRALWDGFYKHANGILQSAWSNFKKFKTHKINYPPTQANVADYNLGIEQLRQRLEKGKKLKGFFVRLPKEAKIVLESFVINGQQISTREHLEIVEARIHYEKLVQQFRSLWESYVVELVDGPVLEDSSFLIVGFESKLSQVREVFDWEEKFGQVLISKLDTLGIAQQKAYKIDFLEKISDLLEHHRLINEHARLSKIFKDWISALPKEACETNAHPLWKHIRCAFHDKHYTKYQEAYNEVTRLDELMPKNTKLEALLSRLRGVAPIWALQLEAEAKKNRNLTPPRDWQLAWRWSKLNNWLEQLHNREDMDSLQKKLEVEKDKERQLVEKLVASLTWQRQLDRVTPEQRQALIAWSQAIKRYGKGAGKHAQYHLVTARKEMLRAQEAVPVWIMPLHRVVQSFYPPRPNMFDVIIVDEASQCDLRALPVLYRASKVLIIGDPEQISPESIGISQDKVFQLIKLLLSEIPHPERFDLQSSLYHIAKLRLPTRIFLKEHFRCVPEIIGFSNHHIYGYGDDKIEPLRIPNPGNALLPPLNTIYIPNGFKNENNDVNEPEAEVLVDKLVECCKDAKYRDKTMGVISLLGEQQAKYIDNLLRSRLDEREIEKRKIICGDAYSFQGDERDVMFLSLVVANNAKFTVLNKETDKQRFNVAASRARDQVFLFHSVNLSDINNKNCMRYKLLDWYLNPRVAEIEAGLETLKKKAESHFEIDVGSRIIKRDFKIIPQYEVLTRKRIDLVVQGKESRLAVECDGDKWHDLDRWEEDQRREEQLHRAGWTFWRVTASAFYRNPDKALSSLWEKLKELKIEPYSN